jgi:hypothetical protein
MEVIQIRRYNIPLLFMTLRECNLTFAKPKPIVSVVIKSDEKDPDTLECRYIFYNSNMYNQHVEKVALIFIM